MGNLFINLCTTASPIISLMKISYGISIQLLLSDIQGNILEPQSFRAKVVTQNQVQSWNVYDVSSEFTEPCKFFNKIYGI